MELILIGVLVGLFISYAIVVVLTGYVLAIRKKIRRKKELDRLKSKEGGLREADMQLRNLVKLQAKQPLEEALEQIRSERYYTLDSYRIMMLDCSHALSYLEEKLRAYIGPNGKQRMYMGDFFFIPRPDPHDGIDRVMRIPKPLVRYMSLVINKFLTHPCCSVENLWVPLDSMEASCFGIGFVIDDLVMSLRSMNCRLMSLTIGVSPENRYSIIDNINNLLKVISSGLTKLSCLRLNLSGYRHKGVVVELTNLLRSLHCGLPSLELSFRHASRFEAHPQHDEYLAAFGDLLGVIKSPGCQRTSISLSLMGGNFLHFGVQELTNASVAQDYNLISLCIIAGVPVDIFNRDILSLLAFLGSFTRPTLIKDLDIRFNPYNYEGTIAILRALRSTQLEELRMSVCSLMRNQEGLQKISILEEELLQTLNSLAPYLRSFEFVSTGFGIASISRFLQSTVNRLSHLTLVDGIHNEDLMTLITAFGSNRCQLSHFKVRSRIINASILNTIAKAVFHRALRGLRPVKFESHFDPDFCSKEIRCNVEEMKDQYCQLYLKASFLIEAACRVRGSIDRRLYANRILFHLVNTGDRALDIAMVHSVVERIFFYRDARVPRSRAVPTGHGEVAAVSVLRSRRTAASTGARPAAPDYDEYGGGGGWGKPAPGTG